MRKSKYRWLTKNLLEKEYINKKLSIKKIAAKYNTSYGLVRKRLKIYKINIRPRPKKILIDKNILKRLFINERKTYSFIKKYFNISSVVLINNLYLYNLKRTYNKCIDCGKKIRKINTRCQKCYYKYVKESGIKKGKNNPAYGKKAHNNKQKSVTCDNCLKNILKPPCFIYNRNFCSKSCRDKYFKESGFYKLENNPNWRGGISFEPYNVKWNETLKNKIRNKFNNNCALCNKTRINNKNRKMSIHHIDYNKLNCDENNLIPLCIKCHSLTNHNRDFWYLLLRR